MLRRDPASERLPWRSLTRTVLVPNVLHAVGQGAVLTATPIAALDLGASYAAAAVVTAMIMVGQLATTLPAGWLVGRFGEKLTMLLATAVTAAGAVFAWIAHTLPLLAAGMFLVGSGVAVFTMARHAWITVAMPVSIRGRTLSLVAGFNRLGMLVGPFLAAAAFAVTGSATSPFAATAVLSVGLAGLVAVTTFPSAAQPDENSTAPRVFRTMWDNRRVLIQLGLVTSIINTMRNSRRILVPLCGAALGLDEVSIALVVGFSAAVDFSLFYVGGVITDRLGRLWVALPTLWIFGAAHLLLSLGDLLPASVTWFVVSAMSMALVNGISSGVVATMGSDLADQRSPAAFLSSWRLVVEIGPAVAPLVIAGVTAAASLGVACVAMAGLSVGGALTLPRYVRRHLPALPPHR